MILAKRKDKSIPTMLNLLNPLLLLLPLIWRLLKLQDQEIHRKTVFDSIESTANIHACPPHSSPLITRTRKDLVSLPWGIDSQLGGIVYSFNN